MERNKEPRQKVPNSREAPCCIFLSHIKETSNRRELLTGVGGMNCRHKKIMNGIYLSDSTP
jgi:hypothetical protein